MTNNRLENVKTSDRLENVTDEKLYKEKLATIVESKLNKLSKAKLAQADLKEVIELDDDHIPNLGEVIELGNNSIAEILTKEDLIEKERLAEKRLVEERLVQERLALFLIEKEKVKIKLAKAKKIEKMKKNNRFVFLNDKMVGTFIKDKGHIAFVAIKAFADKAIFFADHTNLIFNRINGKVIIRCNTSVDIYRLRTYIAQL